MGCLNCRKVPHWHVLGHRSIYCHVLGVCDYRRGMDWILDLTQLGTTSNHSAIADFHNSRITTAPTKPFPACYVFTSRFLATALNSGDSSASCAQVLPLSTLIQNCLPAIPSTELDRHLFSASLEELNCTQLSTDSIIFDCRLTIGWPGIVVI
jgi:hypothetical protein